METIVTLYRQSNWDFIYKSYVDYVDDWFLASSPTSPIMIVGAYLLFILKIGPAYMKNRPAYNLRTVLRVYNFAQTLLSCYMVYYGTSVLAQSGFLESQCLLQDKEYTHTLMVGAYLYTTAKLTELLDTIFFVLRKKWSQISFLHVYHHTFMYCICWYTMKYAPSYMFAFMATLNSFVHVIMYAYYGLSTFPELTKYLWWKKYITKLQLVQFFMMIVSLTFNYITSKCPQSVFLLVLSWANCILFMYLFAKFYIDNYNKNKEHRKDIAKTSGNMQNDFLMSSNNKIKEKRI